MKSENKLARFAILVLLLTMIALVLLSSTYAKYVTTLTGQDTATVAKWEVNLNGENVTGQTQLTQFDLFKATGVNDLKGLGDDLSAAEETADSDVATGAKVAPGTWGKVSFEVTNTSDVTAGAKFIISELTTTLPLEFSQDGKAWVSAKDIADAITDDTPYALGNEMTLERGAEAQTISLYWKWDFESNADADETALGVAGTATCTITAGASFEQVD